MSQDNGASAIADRACALRAEPAAQSQAEPLVPSAGAWLVIRDWNLSVREVTKVTPKLVKLGAGTSRHPSQIGRDDSRIVCCVPDRKTAERVRDSVAGIDGEYDRRRQAANEEARARIKAADEARQKAIARLLASGIEAPSGVETAQTGSTEGESPAREAGDAR